MSANWDAHIGWRRDLKPEPGADWLVLGMRGTAPYYIATEAMLYVNEDSLAQLILSGEYAYLLTQRMVLTPSVELLAHNKDDEDAGTGAGVAALELGLRLGYELRREITPYVRVGWVKLFGATADYAEAAGEDDAEREFAVGISAWF